MIVQDATILPTWLGISSIYLHNPRRPSRTIFSNGQFGFMERGVGILKYNSYLCQEIKKLLTMKRSLYILMLGFVVLTACTNTKNTKDDDNTRILMNDSVDAYGVRRMQVSDTEQTITLKGEQYLSHVKRMPSDSLPRVKSGTGDVFIDNTITLRITRGGTRIFNKTFTKQSFSSLISADFLKHAILEGMVFDKTSTGGFVYAASVTYPQTDLYFPISITIAPDGKMSMVKDELMEDIYPEDTI